MSIRLIWGWASLTVCALGALFAASALQAGQSVRITAINGVAVRTNPPYDEYEAQVNQDGMIAVAWAAEDTICTGGGVDEFNIYIDGQFYGGPSLGRATSGVVLIDPQDYPVFGLTTCQHTI